MRINIQYHIRLRMPGISLGSFDIAAVQLQLIGDTGMTEAVEHDSRQIVSLDEGTEGSIDGTGLRRHSQRTCHHEIKVLILIAQSVDGFLLAFLPLDQHLRHGTRQEDFSYRGSGFRSLQYLNRGGSGGHRRKYQHNILTVKLVQCIAADSLQLLIDLNISLALGNRLRRNLHTIPGKP